MQFAKKMWGEYVPSDGDKVQDTISSAKAAGALIEADDLQRYENALSELSSRIDQVVPMDTLGQPVRFRGTFESVPTSLLNVQDGDYIFILEV